MLLLCGVIAAVLIGTILVFFSIQFVFFTQKRLQSQADELALNIARKLNDADSAGLMNHMIAYSRESVFNSRSTYQTITDQAPQMEPIARQLLNDTRDGVFLVNRERSKLIAAQMVDVKKTVENENKNPPTGIMLPWASYSTPTVTTVQIGSIKGVESNAQAPEGNDPLLDLDNSNHYFQPDTKLYYANKVDRLPPPDSDLDFQLSSLAAPVKGTISPPRLASADVFKEMSVFLKDGKQMTPTPPSVPSAVAVEIQCTVKVVGPQTREDILKSRAIAAAVGAGPPL